MSWKAAWRKGSGLRNGVRQMVESEGTERPRNRRVCTSGRGLTNAKKGRQL